MTSERRLAKQRRAAQGLCAFWIKSKNDYCPARPHRTSLYCRQHERVVKTWDQRVETVRRERAADARVQALHRPMHPNS